MIYRARLFGREIASLEVIPDAPAPSNEELQSNSVIGGGSSHNFEKSDEADPEILLGFHARVDRHRMDRTVPGIPR